MSSSVTVQLGMFGGYNDVIGLHVVEAHTRVMHDGTEVFVGEHLRWNRGRKTPRAAAPRPSEPPPDQPSLFDAPVAAKPT